MKSTITQVLLFYKRYVYPFPVIFIDTKGKPVYQWGGGQGGGGTGIEGAESGVEGAGSGSRGGGKRGHCGRGSGKIEGRNYFFY